MSSTNRGGKRNESDFYASPPWAVDRFAEEAALYPDIFPSGRWLEPCGGDGEIVRTMNKHRSDIVWSIGELREEERPNLAPLAPGGLYIGDFLQMPEATFGGERFKVAITNPPFSLALPIIQKCIGMADITVMLLRLNFWGSQERFALMQTNPPDTLVLPDRPAFCCNKDGKPSTDSIEYAWFVWHSEFQREGRIKVLGQTSTAERKKWSELLKRRYEEAKAREVAPEPSAEGVGSGSSYYPTNDAGSYDGWSESD